MKPVREARPGPHGGRRGSMKGAGGGQSCPQDGEAHAAALRALEPGRRERAPITAAVLAGLRTRRRRRRRSLPANVPLTKQRRRQRRPGPSRDLCVTAEGGASTRHSRAARRPAHKARGFLGPRRTAREPPAPTGGGSGRQRRRESLRDFSDWELSGS